MPLVDFEQVLAKFRSVDDAKLVDECRRLGLTVDATKFNHAYNAYSVTEVSESHSIIQRHGLVILRAYVVFCLMRSSQFEDGLDGISEDSPLQPWKRFFRKGPDDKKTAGQCIRNSLGRVTFEVSEDLKAITFRDRDNHTTVDSEMLYNDLCPQVMRFYRAA